MQLPKLVEKDSSTADETVAEGSADLPGESHVEPPGGASPTLDADMARKMLSSGSAQSASVKPEPPSSVSSFASRYMPSFLKKARKPSKETSDAQAQSPQTRASFSSAADPENEEAEDPTTSPTLTQLQAGQGRAGGRSLPIPERKCATDYSASSINNAQEYSDGDLALVQKELWAQNGEEGTAQ